MAKTFVVLDEHLIFFYIEVLPNKHFAFSLLFEKYHQYLVIPFVTFT
jgi:hypothetical protein